MNCAECREQLVLYIEQLLDGVQAEQVAEHVATCDACRAELEGLATLQGRLVADGQAVAQSNLEDEVMNRIIREQSARLKGAARASASLRLRRSIMKSPKTRIAAAAAVIVACVLATTLWQGTQPIALADVLAKIEQIQAYMFKTTVAVGKTSSEITVLVSDDYGMRVDRTSVNSETGEETQFEMYFLPHEKAVVMVEVSEKKYARITLNDATLEKTKMENRDPRQMLKHLLACEYRELGRSVVDGHRVQGFETTDPAFLGGAAQSFRMTMWVDEETWLPVRSETEIEVGGGLRATSAVYDFQWGVVVEASQFEPDIPADFTLHPIDSSQQPSYNEQGFIEALQLAAEFTGHYPEGLDHESFENLTTEITQAMVQGKSPVVRGWHLRMSSLTLFNVILVSQQKDPVYHGDVVTPEDAALPLMRWKTEDGQYRVIFGDLHTETVSADVLADLEAALPQ